MNVPALIQFLAGLEQNNNRPWFVHNKPAYDILRDEFSALVADVIRRVAKFDPALGPVDTKKAMFRIYRDVRFSKDKSPYKTHFSALIGERKSQDTLPWYYLQIDHKGVLMVGGGLYQPDKLALAKVRRFIAERPEKFARLLCNARFKRTFGGLWEEDKLARPPKGFTTDTPHIEAIRNRHFIGIAEIDLAKNAPADLAVAIANLCRDAQPLVAWLREAIGSGKSP